MRTFIGIKVNEEVMELVEELVTSLRRMGFRGNWVKPENVHLTLFFLGEQPEDRVRHLAEHLGKRLRGFPSFSFSVKNFGFFTQRSGQPRVLWLGVEAPESLYRLYEEIRAELKQHHFSFDDKRFKPHLTICRLKEVPSMWEKLVDGIKIEEKLVVVNDVRIFSSTLTPEGPIYKAMYICDFEGGLITNG
ncbi:MAG: 2,3-cyclic 3-phosphodiesterase [Thermotogota bacterium]|nr:2,3-cyclic 3-phosphodiesterase [Thermotogota bacterium]MDK2865354.1 2,3-cyclic 3-phosphodiesterase [Thermotogota bacterium]HCZ07296.1 RNA 2',3'-cyclic phosphodiesterase [Thermotogota bacterium]